MILDCVALKPPSKTSKAINTYGDLSPRKYVSPKRIVPMSNNGNKPNGNKAVQLDIVYCKELHIQDDNGNTRISLTTSEESNGRLQVVGAKSGLTIDLHNVADIPLVEIGLHLKAELDDDFTKQFTIFFRSDVGEVRVLNVTTKEMKTINLFDLLSGLPEKPEA